MIINETPTGDAIKLEGKSGVIEQFLSNIDLYAFIQSIMEDNC